MQLQSWNLKVRFKEFLLQCGINTLRCFTINKLHYLHIVRTSHYIEHKINIYLLINVLLGPCNEISKVRFKNIYICNNYQA